MRTAKQRNRHTTNIHNLLLLQRNCLW